MAYKPSLWRRLKSAWNFFQAGYPTKQSPYSWPAWRERKPDWQILDFAGYVEEGFNSNSLIYSALLYKYRSSLLAPLRAYGKDPMHPEVLPPGHPLSRLLARPNPYQSGLEFQGLNEIYLNLAGNVYVHLDRPGRGAPPRALRTLRPDRVFIVPEKGGIKGYLYVPEGRFPTVEDLATADIVPILPEDMMHIKLPNPGDPLEGLGQGLSPVSSMAKNADVDNNVTSFLKRFFERGTMLAGLLTFETPLDRATIDEIQERWKEKYGGWENMAEEIGVLGSGGKYQRLTQSFEEMGFDAIDKRSETRILGPFGVPLILLGTRAGIEASTLANYEQSDRHFWNNTMVPERQLFEAEYQYFLGAADGAYPAFDLTKIPSLQKDIPKLAEAAARLWSIGMPANQALTVVGIDAEDIEDGDVSYVPSSVRRADEPPPAPAAPALPAPRRGGQAEPEEEPGMEDVPQAEEGAQEETRKGVLRPFRHLQGRALARPEGGDLAQDRPDGHGLGGPVCGCGCGELRAGPQGDAGHDG